MNNFLRWACVAVIFTATVSCSAPSKAWNGTWKLNVSKSSSPGPDFTYSILPSGEYHFDNGTYSYNYRCDGKEYPSIPNHTISCTQGSAIVRDSTAKENGKIVGTVHAELSADGKMLTIKAALIQPDGSVKSSEKVYSRTSGSMGFAGGWTNTKRLESQPQMLLALNEQMLHIAFSGSDQYSDIPLDGSDATMHGPGISQGLTMSIKPRGSREFLTLKKFQGKVINQGFLRISADGRTLLEGYWRPDKPDERAVLLYEKQ